MLNRVCITCVVMASYCGLLATAGVPGLWLDVPFVKQDKDGCGAASIAMVMQYWDRQQGQELTLSSDAVHIQQVLISRTAHGIFASDMERYFQQNGYATFAFAGDWDVLHSHLQKGRPLIVALKPGSHLPLHYVVVAGLDAGSELVLLNDPAQRKLVKEDGARFEEEWKAAGHWTLLAVPKRSVN
jgi:ABC-type bacteriocin/lantibiotic exporter with double-glycine peptidase domain